MAGFVPLWEPLLKVLRTAEGTMSRAVARGDCGCLQPLSSPYHVRVEKPKHKSCFCLHSPRFSSLLILCVLSAEQCNCNLDLAKKLGQFQVSLQRLVAGLWSQGLVDKTTFFFFCFWKEQFSHVQNHNFDSFCNTSSCFFHLLLLR